MKRRPVLGKGAESIFTITKIKEEKEIPIEAPIKTAVSTTAKFKTFEVKLSVLLREDQLDHLKGLERMIMKKRSSKNKQERITKNTILRTYIDALSGIDLDISEIKNEEELLQRIKKALQINKQELLEKIKDQIRSQLMT